MKQALLAAAVLGGLAFSVAARATIISATYDISATFTPALAGFPNPLTGSFTLTFDNSANISDTTVGLTVNSLNHPDAASMTVAYTYNKPLDLITFGGLGDSVAGVFNNKPDFKFEVGNVSSAPTPVFAREAVLGLQGVLTASAETLTVNAVTEPMSAALLGVGLLGIGAVRRRDAA